MNEVEFFNDYVSPDKTALCFLVLVDFVKKNFVNDGGKIQKCLKTKNDLKIKA